MNKNIVLTEDKIFKEKKKNLFWKLKENVSLFLMILHI